MDSLKQRICQEGLVLNENVLKVDSFLNHQLDPELIMEIGAEIAARYQNDSITKVLTIESSGIAVALGTALRLKVPVLFARKRKTILMTDEVYHTQVFSYTKKEQNDITVLRKFLQPHDRILIVDDFLASGEAALGMAQIIESAGCILAGFGIVIEKSFQSGRQRILDKGYRLESLVRIQSLHNGKVIFVEDKTS